MTGKKQKAAVPEPPKAVKVPGRAEWPNLTVRDLDVRYVKPAAPRGSA